MSLMEELSQLNGLHLRYLSQCAIDKIAILKHLQAIHYKKYTTASDVWSFGCVMYEIWSVGRKPFEGFTNAEVM